MHDVGVVLDLHELVDGDRARRRDATDVVAAQVDQHDVLGALLLVGEQVGAQAAVLGSRGAARTRAGERTREHAVALDAHERLGARAHERHVARADVEHVRRRVHRAQHAVEVEPVALVGCRVALREHDLEDVAGRDVLLGGLDLVDELLARGVRLHRHRSRHAVGTELGAARPDVDALEVGVDALERRVVGQVGRSTRPHRRDDLHDAARVVERDHDVGHHEREVRHVEHVDLMPRNPLEGGRGLVAHVADRAAHEQRQSRYARDASGAQLAGHDAQRVVGELPGQAAVLDDDLVAASADDRAVPHAQEAVAAEPLAPDDALEEERVLGTVGQRQKRADRRREVRVDLTRHRNHVVLGGERDELFSARQYHVRFIHPSSWSAARAREYKKPSSIKGRELSRGTTLVAPPASA